MMPVCIAGMHRSGTSMVTMLLHKSGLYLGPESDFHAPVPENPEGHWENRRFYKLNQRILRQLGGGWDYPPPLPSSWTAGPLAPITVEAETLVNQFVDREPWGWKDPRNCLTLPFWQAILGTVQVVVVVRNPLEVAESLRKRNGFSRALSLALWHTYNQRLLDAVAPSDRIITHYDMHFQDPEGELRRLLNFLALPVDEDIVAEASATGVSELRHYRLTTRDLLEADDVAPAIVELYRDLCTEANWQDLDSARVVDPTQGKDPSPGDGDEPAESAYARRQDKRSGVRSRRRPLAQASARIAELEQTVRAQQIALAEHEANARKFREMWKLVADRTGYAGKVEDELAALVRDETT
jgi:hypothetical protein